ncbi:MAG: heme lyase CcmF/NrfE family subunit [Alphaproteobacteria bacterium]
MISEWAHLALVLAFPLAFMQAVTALLPAAPLGWTSAYRQGVVRWVAMATAVLISLSFLGLVLAFVTGDFSVKTTFEHSHSAKPLLYKISGTWGNHEGSILLWVLILAVFGGLLALRKTEKHQDLRVRALGIQALITLAFLAFTIFTSNPFERLIPAPVEGRGLNPLLQDIGLALHPPLLYFGYVGFSITFALTVAALLRGEADRDWARLVRPWAMIAWTTLTAGIALGSWWAYYELGWGGFWAWDPVENLSFLPWLTGTAFIHSLMVVEKSGALRVWTLFLGVVTFVLAILGTFVVRSGLLTSVHAFAVDPARGVFILLILGISVIAAFSLFAWRAPQFKAGGGFEPVSREGALVLNNLFLSTGAGVVLLGTFFPLITEAFGQPLTVGKPYFDATFLPFMVPLLLLMAIGPFVPWQRLRGKNQDRIRGLLTLLVVALAIAAIVIVLLYWQSTPRLSVAVALAMVLAGWLLGGGLLTLASRVRAVGSLTKVSLSAWAVSLAHAGLGIAVFGLIAGSAMVQERTVNLKPGDSVEVGHLTFRLDGVRETNVDPAQGRNYVSAFADVALLDRSGGVKATLSPERRFYPVRQDSTTEAAIRVTWLGDIFLAFNTQAPDGGFVLSLSWRPLIPWLYFGCILMVLGGMLGSLAAWRRLGRAQ